MKKKTIFLFFLLWGVCGFNQEINCSVTMDARQTGKMQLSIFNTLQNSIEEFVNKTNWTDQRLPATHQVNCNLFIVIHSYSANKFEGTLRIQSSRPVFGANMATPIFNFRDKKFKFDYTEDQPLDFNPNVFESDLVSTLSFYVYIILGLDADTFALNGGEEYFEKADQIANTARQGGNESWNSFSEKNSRATLNRELSSSNFQDFHKALYRYHRKGLDLMHREKEIKQAKENVVKSIALLKNVNQSRSNTLLIRAFFDAKAGELVDIFTGGPAVKTAALVENLNKLAPAYSTAWSGIQ